MHGLRRMSLAAMATSMLPIIVGVQIEMESRKADLVKFMACYMPDADAWKYAQEAAESMDLALAIKAASAGHPFHLAPRR